MKLVDILARELRAWPKGFGKSVGQCHHGAIHSCRLPYLQSGQKFTRCDNYMTDVVSRAQWQAAVDALKTGRAGSGGIKWNGEGLPPVGVDALLAKECKFTEGARLESFPAGTVVYVGGRANFGGCDLAVIIIKGRHFCGTIIPELLKPIRTPEQIAKQERSKACDKMYGVILDKVPQDRRNNGSDICEALYDAGYRKFEIVDN